MIMIVFGTQMHIVTAVFIGLEMIMFLFQMASYLYWPRDSSRKWYLLLLMLMLLYNITGGLFPDPQIEIPLKIQEMIAYGTGFIMASYFPFYFYKGFDLKSLRWHALFGVPLFLILPYIFFFVILYAINDQLTIDIRIGMIIPFAYAFVLLWAIFRAIHRQYNLDGNKFAYLEKLAMYVAVTPWAALAFFGLVEENQLIETLCTNTGIIIITILFVSRSLRMAREDLNNQLKKPTIDSMPPDEFMANCLHYGITKTEILVVQKIYKGMRNREIASTMYISEETVKKHVQNLLRKTAVKNRAALIHKLQNHRQ